jgi:ribonuclease P protein component
LSLLGAAGRGASDSRSEASARDQRFPRSCRLRSRREFVEVYAKGRRVGSSSFTLFALPNDRTTCRLGVTVSRKIGGAVVRNRVKRLLREVFRRNRSGLEPAMDLVVNAHRAISGKSYRELEGEFLRSFSTLARRSGR